MRWLVLSWRDQEHPEAGGSEAYIAHVAGELARRGHQVTLWCSRPEGQPAGTVADGVRVVRGGGRLGVYPRGLAWLWRHRREYDVVVDVINGVPFGVPLLRRRGVVALVHHVHREQWRIIYPGLRGRIGWFLERRVTPLLYRRVPFLTVSEASRRDLRSLGVSSPITIARNGLATHPVTTGPSSRPTLSAQPSICVLARHVPHKQIEHAIAVTARLRGELPGLRLDLIGDGWWTERLRDEVRRLGVEQQVVFHGHVTDQERDRLLAGAWVMLLPSVKEGWGLAVMEAARQGTPTVGYRYAGGLAESVIDGLTGLLADDESGLTDQVRRVLLDAGLRDQLAANAACRAASFTWKETADVVEEVGYRVRSGRRS